MTNLLEMILTLTLPFPDQRREIGDHGDGQCASTCKVQVKWQFPVSFKIYI